MAELASASHGGWPAPEFSFPVNANNDVAISVLYIHHAGAFGGASRSLSELIRGFPENAVAPRVITQRGTAARFVADAGAQVIETAGISRFDNTRYGHYRGLRWLLLLRELYYAPFTLAAILRAQRRWPDIDLVHVNELVALLAIAFAKRLLRKPVIVHVRSVQSDGRGLAGRLVWWTLRRCADAVIAIDETVRASLPPELPCSVVHNSYSPGVAAAPEARNAQGKLRVGMVGNLLPLKGVYEFLEAARICRDRRMDVEFVLVGGNPRRLSGLQGWLLEVTGFAQDVESDVKCYIAQHDLQSYVRLAGFTADVDVVYRDLDVLCFPSHLDAVGRPVYEAAYWKVPSIVAIHNPLPDTFVSNQTGLAVEPRDPKALADAIAYFYERRDEVRRMGEAAYALAMANFDARTNAAKVLDIYRGALERARGSAA